MSPITYPGLQSSLLNRNLRPLDWTVTRRQRNGCSDTDRAEGNEDEPGFEASEGLLGRGSGYGALCRLGPGGRPARGRERPADGHVRDGQGQEPRNAAPRRIG